MVEYKIEIPVQIKRTDELTERENEWRKIAIAAAKQAYAPYSNFQVGAVVILKDDTVVTGNNQENAAYPSGLCAERVALFSASAHYPDNPAKAIVIVSLKDGVIQDKISPCGACRQVLLESEMRYNYPIQIMLCGKDENRFVHSTSALLPLSFDAGNL